MNPILPGRGIKETKFALLISLEWSPLVLKSLHLKSDSEQLFSSFSAPVEPHLGKIVLWIYFIVSLFNLSLPNFFFLFSSAAACCIPFLLGNQF